MKFTKNDIIDALKTVYDPELPVNIWDLGLIYDIKIDTDKVTITMTFTSPTCPMMEELLNQIHDTVSGVVAPAVVDVKLVWEPAWDLSRMSDAARFDLDLTSQGW